MKRVQIIHQIDTIQILNIVHHQQQLLTEQDKENNKEEGKRY